MATMPTGTVTFLFTDIEGSTARWEQHPAAMAVALARHNAILHTAIERHGGVVFRTAGDAFCAAFASAPAALDAAIQIQRALQAEPWGAGGALRVRQALHTGAADIRDGDYYGLPIGRVARILAAGHGGQILLSRAAEELLGDALPPGVALRDLGTYQLKDLSRPEQIFQLLVGDLPDEFPPLRSLGPPAAREAAPAAGTLLATKLYAPPARPNLVARPRLIERLRKGLAGKLTLVAAPAGFGKSTLISEWIGQNDERRMMNDEGGARRSSLIADHFKVAWVALDRGDNDPLRFWSYVITALGTLQPNSGAGALGALRSLQPPPIEAVLTPLLNALSALPGDAVLVLDDYHLIDAPPIHRSVAFLLEHLPPQLHVLIATRVDPPLPLTRLRARGQLTELRAADLRFTPDEAAAFLRDARGLTLANDQIVALDAHIEGWIAGLQLTALAMRDRSDVDGFIAAFTGSNRFVVDYLADEVIDRLPKHLQSFLLQTAVLDRMCGPLCDAVLGLEARDLGLAQGAPSPKPQVPDPASYSQLILDEIERANLFLIALDDQRRWYRYHHLFAEVLRHRLASGASGEAIAGLHRRAAGWFEQQGSVAEAIQHALLASDRERAARLIEQAGAALATQGQVHTVLGWLGALPDSLIRAHPVLCIIHGAMLMYTNHLPAAAARLDDAERCVGPETPADQARGILGQVAVLRGNIARFVGDLERCVRLSVQALDLLPETEVFPHAAPLMRIGRTGALVDAAYAFLLSGDARPETERQILEAIATARATNNRFATLRSINLLARLQILQGRLRAAAAAYADAALVASGPRDLHSLVNSSAYYFGMAELLREHNELDAAERYLAQGMELARGALTIDAHVLTRGFLTLARLRQAQGDRAGALAALDEFAGLARQRAIVAELAGRAAAMRAWLNLAHDLPAAAAWAEAHAAEAAGELRYPREAEHMIFARVLLAPAPAGHPRRALHLLDRLLAAAEASGRQGSVIELLVLRALALGGAGERDAALACLERALALAEPEGYVRVFVDEGAPLAELLKAIDRRGVAREYVARLLAAFPQELGASDLGVDEGAQAPSLKPQTSLVEPLTARELEILRLLVGGASNRGIARDLVLSLGTVKKHVNNIFGKLGVQSRTQAIVKARQHNLV